MPSFSSRGSIYRCSPGRQKSRACTVISKSSSRKQIKPFLTYSIYFGIAWSEETPQPAKSPEYEALSANLEKRDFGRTNWWLGIKYFDFRVGDDPQILEQLASGDMIEEEVASEFVNFITHYAKGAERLNKVLASPP